MIPIQHLLLAIFFCAATPQHAADTFTFSNHPGPHGVGLKIVQQYDYTRQYKLWIDMMTSERPTFRDYLETVPAKTT